MDGAGNFQYESEDMFGNPGTFGGTLDISNTGIITFEGNPTLHGVMNIDKNIIAWTEGWGFGKYGLTVLVKSEKTSISGSISHEGTPLCTMVLANGEYMFTCDDSLGLYDLDVPLDQNGEITLFGFCSGLSPYMTILTPDQALGFDIAMTHAAAGSREVEVTVQTEPGVTNPEYFRVSGTATYGEEDLCTMVLINGQNMFSCDANLGTFDLEVPLDSNGEITLYVFCSGFAPYKDVFAP
jgi:hypothetical protein